MFIGKLIILIAAFQASTSNAAGFRKPLLIFIPLFIGLWWTIAGTNLLELRYTKPGVFSADPSEIVRPNNCRRPNQWEIVDERLRGDWRIDEALSRLPRQAFDYVWLINVPGHDPRLLEGLEQVWTGPGSKLYRIRKGGEAPPPATRRTASASVR